MTHSCVYVWGHDSLICTTMRRHEPCICVNVRTWLIHMCTCEYMADLYVQQYVDVNHLYVCKGEDMTHSYVQQYMKRDSAIGGAWLVCTCVPWSVLHEVIMNESDSTRFFFEFHSWNMFEPCHADELSHVTLMNESDSFIWVSISVHICAMSLIWTQSCHPHEWEWLDPFIWVSFNYYIWAISLIWIKSCHAHEGEWLNPFNCVAFIEYIWAMSLIWSESCHPHEWEWLDPFIWVTLMEHIKLSHLTRMIKLNLTYELSHITRKTDRAQQHCSRHGLHISQGLFKHADTSCHTHEWVTSHIWMSHVTHMNANDGPTACNSEKEKVAEHTRMSPVTYINKINKPRHMYEGVFCRA